MSIKNYIFFKISPDGLCLPAAILNQVCHAPSYTPEMAMRQAGFHMLRNPNKFYKAIENELIDSGESYESYCYNVYHGKVWGDDLVAAAFSNMWNVSISIISPCYKYPVDVFHNQDNPDIVLIANGGSYMAHSNKTTHFSSSHKKDPNHKLPGRELVNKTVGIEPGLVYKKLEPTILHNEEQARKMAIDEYINVEKEKSLELLCGITRQIKRLDKHIVHLIHESDLKKDARKKLAYKLECLGISAEKIAIATQQKDLPYMLSEEMEREVVREDRKRKYEEEEKDEKRKRQRKEMIVMKDGKIISEGDKGETSETGKEAEGEEVAHDKTLVMQQQSIMKDQENLIQQQETQLMGLNLRIKQLENEKAMLLQQQGNQQLQQSQPQQQSSSLPMVPSLSNIPGLPILDDVIQFEDLTVPDQPTGIPSTSSQSSNPFRLENVIRPEHLQYLPKYAAAGVKKEPATTSEEITSQPQVEVINLPPQEASNIVFVPRKVKDKTALVLMPPTQKRTLNKRSNPGMPVPKDNRDPKRFYCENCACHYKEKGDLRKHINFMCMKTSFDYVCEACQKEFHTDYGVREHYYQEHKKEHLYFCTKCNKGFFHKSHKSYHKKSCPKKDEEDRFARRAPYDAELELTFKRRQRVEIPPEVAEIALQAQESDKAAELLEQELEKDKTQEGETVISMDPEGTGLQPDDDGDDDDDDENDDD